MNKTTVVTTTINVPVFLRPLCENAVSYGNNPSVIVIGDVKTPKEAGQYCSELSKEFGMKIKYLDIEDQKKALVNHQNLWDMMPFNDSIRKTIGMFLAYQDGCDRMILTDDDNYVTGSNHVGSHSIAGTTVEIDLIRTESGWYNICESMIEKNRIPFYPRGYPWSQRFKNLNNITKEKKKAKVVVNLGFVLEDPDIDALSRLFWPIKVIAIDSHFEPHFGLSPGTWAPFNDQNTAICRELIPVFFKPLSTGRNADIWTSYFVARLTEHMGDVVAYGQPFVKQTRNYHDHREDYRIEELNNRATDQFVDLLRSIKLTKHSYIDVSGELINKCLDQISSINAEDIVGGEDPIHHQLPCLAAQIKAKEEEMDMIRNFFLDYQKWHSFISKVV